MSTTLGDMIDEVVLNLAGYTLQQDKATYLKTAVTTTTSSSAAPTVLSLGTTENVGMGIIEIDEELMHVQEYDRVAQTATISPFGRGYLGTTASTHPLDSKVTISPTFPRSVIKKNINQTLNAIGSTIFAVKTVEFEWNPVQTTYGFNGLNIQSILSISWQEIGPSQEWIPINRFSFDSAADEAAFGVNAQTITIHETITPGQKVKVLYSTDPKAFTDNAQDFVTQSGLPDSCWDVVVLGATYRLLSNLDPARASMTSPQADETNAKRPFGSSNSAAKQMYAFFQQRLKEELNRQQLLYPIRVRFNR